MFLDSLAYKAITGGGLLSGEASFFHLRTAGESQQIKG